MYACKVHHCLSHGNIPTGFALDCAADNTSCLKHHTKDIPNIPKVVCLNVQNPVM